MQEPHIKEALADFLAEHLLSEDLEFKDDLPNEPIFFSKKIIKLTVDPSLHWIMHFDGLCEPMNLEKQCQV